MRLTGVNMKAKKMVWGLNVWIFCSLIFSENDILWDFGVIITPPEYQNIFKDNPLQTQTKQKDPNVTINAVISDPFIPPVRSTFSPEVSDPLDYKLSEDLTALTLEKNINQIKSIA